MYICCQECQGFTVPVPYANRLIFSIDFQWLLTSLKAHSKERKRGQFLCIVKLPVHHNFIGVVVQIPDSIEEVDPNLCRLNLLLRQKNKKLELDVLKKQYKGQIILYSRERHKLKEGKQISFSPLQRILDMDLSPNWKYLATTSDVNLVF
jgi:hypothetical protein